MRYALEKREGERLTFEGKLAAIKKRRRKKTSRKHTTLLVVDIYMIEDQVKTHVTDHQWFFDTQGFEDAALKEGDVFQFEGRIRQYTKGYKGRSMRKQKLKPIKTDYKIIYPTQIKKI